MEESAELTALMNRFYEACVAGDTAAFASLLPDEPGVLMIGTAPEEWWAGHATIMRVTGAQMAALGGGFPLYAGDPRAYRAGSVGWAADQPHLRMPDGTDVPLRLTAVFHEQDGVWKMVQSHFSIGVANEESFGQELPTG